jgi:hypothetical protein
MPRLTPCPSCSSHVLTDERECPHCGASLRTIAAPRVAAVVVGLTLGGCILPQPAYGIPDPSTSTGTEGTAGTSTDTGSTDAQTSTAASEGTSTGMADSTTGDTEATAGSGTAGEPDYGVPETTTG